MWLVYKKELLELLRDKKTMFFVIALPLLVFPVLFGVLTVVMANAQLNEEKKIHSYVIVGEQYAQAFADDLFYHKSFKKVAYQGETDLASLTEAIRHQEFDLAIVIPADFAEQVAANQQSNWQIVFNDAAVINRIHDRTTGLIGKHADLIQRDKLIALGVPTADHEAILTPVVVSKVDTADKRENIGEKLGGIIPYILIPLCLVGAIYPAIDLGAGEKERGTLETLLLTPVSRTALVLGKFYTVLTTSLLSALITVSSMGFWAVLMGSVLGMKAVHNAVGVIGVLDLSLVLLMLLPMACIFSSLLLAISIYARTFKEAQNYMGPLHIVIAVPIVAALVPGMKLGWVTAFIPVMNVALGIKEVIKGTVDYSMIGVIFVAMTTLAIAMIAFSVHWFGKEEVLFR
ncbi:MAG: sodium transport system permease protein [Phenylobacterium sp.]|jgi:sodium transport system permease protein